MNSFKQYKKENEAPIYTTLADFTKACNEKELEVRKLSSSDAEDTYEHYYAGNDLYTFSRSGGDLMPNNGYYSIEHGDDFGHGEIQ